MKLAENAARLVRQPQAVFRVVAFSLAGPLQQRVDFAPFVVDADFDLHHAHELVVRHVQIVGDELLGILAGALVVQFVDVLDFRQAFEVQHAHRLGQVGVEVARVGRGQREAGAAALLAGRVQDVVDFLPFAVRLLAPLFELHQAAELLQRQEQAAVDEGQHGLQELQEGEVHRLVQRRIGWHVVARCGYAEGDFQHLHDRFVFRSGVLLAGFADAGDLAVQVHRAEPLDAGVIGDQIAVGAVDQGVSLAVLAGIHGGAGRQQDLRHPAGGLDQEVHAIGLGRLSL